MWIGVVTLFPEMFTALTEHGVVGRAVRQELIELEFFNPRDHAEGAYRRVDDRPYGGGPGMVMQVAPLWRALQQAREQAQKRQLRPHVLYMSPQGRVLRQPQVRHWVQERQEQGLILLCGRYEGIDERLLEMAVDEECSIGDYVLSGGELPAMVLVDAMTRWLPGALGHGESAAEDSFSAVWLDCPHYTRPPNFAGREVPAVLLSGDHAEVAHWRHRQRVLRTASRRPDLLSTIELSEEERGWIEGAASGRTDGA